MPINAGDKPYGVEGPGTQGHDDAVVGAKAAGGLDDDLASAGQGAKSNDLLDDDGPVDKGFDRDVDDLSNAGKGAQVDDGDGEDFGLSEAAKIGAGGGVLGHSPGSGLDDDVLAGKGAGLDADDDDALSLAKSGGDGFDDDNFGLSGHDDGGLDDLKGDDLLGDDGGAAGKGSDLFDNDDDDAGLLGH